MTDRKERTPSAFRLNFEQQKNRAKELLRAAKASDANALSRIAAVSGSKLAHTRNILTTDLKLADAQLAIARELRFPSWAKLKAHIDSMNRQRAAIDQKQPAPDSEFGTLHIRCGSDIKNALIEAGFIGDFLEHSTPYCMGPVTNGVDRHELMARFITDTFGELKGGLKYEDVLEGCRQDEERLNASAKNYARVVIWVEHDSWDQLMLARLLAHYASGRRPRVLELIVVNEFPGAQRFIGIGQLPAEALRLLWSTRKPITTMQLALGSEVWNALASSDPRQLASFARKGMPDLPIMAPALHRHLRELPSIENGLSLTQKLVLQILSEGGTATLSDIFHQLSGGLEPLPWMGDWGLMRTVDAMLQVSEPPFARLRPPPDKNAFLQKLTITDTGRAVIRGNLDWLSLNPPSRWVGGVHIQAGNPVWRWNEAHSEVRLV